MRVHGATTDEIALGAPEFPGGAVRLAGSLLRPGCRFYEVEVTEPDSSMGTKFHLFFWDGEAWRMIGPIWRAIR